jgi:hypothetical protein
MMATRTTMMKRVALQLVSNKSTITARSSYHSSSVALLATNTDKKKSTKSRDFRLAGRLRFYKQVGVVEVSPPWEDSNSSDKDADDDTVESPISAGVDGTASASGVQHLSSKHVASTTKEDLKWMLSPRSPGSMDVKKDDNPTQWFGIALDGRTIQTPMGQKLAVPSQSLAYAIAAEWDAQVQHLQPADMPIMTLACTALDQAAYHPQVYRDQAMNFLPTDTVSSCLYAVPAENENESTLFGNENLYILYTTWIEAISFDDSFVSLDIMLLLQIQNVDLLLGRSYGRSRVASSARAGLERLAQFRARAF